MHPQLAHGAFNADDCARDLVRDLHEPKPRLFWMDLVLTAIIGWSAFWAAAALDSYWSIFALVAMSLAMYRGLCFIHELTHIRARTLPGFETAWNLLFGVPLLLPSFVYVGVHQDHHKLSTYGTSQDPEYMPFAKSNLMVIFFVAHSVLIPAFLLLRFVILTPIGLLLPPVHRWLAVHASALSMNLGYRREVGRVAMRSMKIWETVTFGVWACFFAALMAGATSWRILAIWYSSTAIVSLVNALRTLGAHEYESDGVPLDRTKQLLDSIDTPGSFWTELWAPVGLRYHALHHYFPGIPYHNLAEAHRRFVRTLPADAAYHRTLSPGLWRTLNKLYSRGRGARLQSLQHR